MSSNNAKNVRLVQGSHIVVPKLHNHDRAYIFQNSDNRIIFALPYETDYTLIGTTDHDFKGDPINAKITDSEVTYLCSAASEYFEKPIKTEDIVWSYSGVRPLYDDGATAAQEATRDYVLRVDGGADEPKVVNVFGGKITTYRRLAESMLEKIEDLIGSRKESWTADSSLPGGDFAVVDYDLLVSKLQLEFPFLDKALAQRLTRSYGTKAWVMMDGASKVEDMGWNFGGSLTEREVRYLIQHEWAENAEDIVWRRTKLGIRLSDQETKELDNWLQQNI